MTRPTIAVLVLAAACASAPRAPACDAACTDRRTAEATLDRFAHAITLVNADSLAAQYTDDGAMVQPGAMPVVGRRAIHDLLAPFDGKNVVTRETVRADSVRRLDGALRVWGSWEQEGGPRGGATGTYRGHYVADLVRAGSGADTTWRFERFVTIVGDAAGPTYAIDHVILGAADRDAGMREFASRTGVTPQIGGVHPGKGTRNALASFGDLHYVEILAPDPAQGSMPGNAALAAYSALAPEGWAIRTSDIEATAKALRAAGFTVEGPLDGARVRPDGVRLAWRTLNIVAPASERLPFFIEWKTMDAHPSRSAPAGCTLGAVTVTDTHDDAVRALLRAVGVRAGVAHGDASSMRVDLHCGAKGTVTFGR
ncbi:MAG: VOC family protein [Gemmatimonadetes bacterium]|nr:VOC family protein [Gemmatimonadota bacterium]